jgi:hypothetical protein
METLLPALESAQQAPGEVMKGVFHKNREKNGNQEHHREFCVKRLMPHNAISDLHEANEPEHAEDSKQIAVGSVCLTVVLGGGIGRFAMW